MFYDDYSTLFNPRAKKAAPLDAATALSRLWAAARERGYDLDEWAVSRDDVQHVRVVIANALEAAAGNSEEATRDLSDPSRRRTLPKAIAKALLRVIPKEKDRHGLNYAFFTESGTVFATDGYRAFVAPHLFGTPPGLDARTDTERAIPKGVINAAAREGALTLGSRRAAAGDTVERYGSLPGPDIDVVTPPARLLTITLRADAGKLLDVLDEAEKKHDGKPSNITGPYLVINEAGGRAYPYVYHRDEEGRLKVVEVPPAVMNSVEAPGWKKYHKVGLFSKFVKDALLYAKESKIKYVTFSCMDEELTPVIVRAEGDPFNTYSLIMPFRMD